MKIGILTFHCAHNYGAVLQAYGMLEFLKSLNHEAYIIDYRPESVVKCYRRSNNRDWLSKNPKQCFLRLINYVSTLRIRHHRWDKFQNFIKNKLCLFPYHVVDDLNNFDAIIIGSDQVWSPNHTGGMYDNLYFGVGLTCRVIAYGVSNSQSRLEEKEKRFLASHLSKFSALSVREREFRDMLQPFSKIDIQVVADPTILAGHSVFDKIAKVSIRKRPYVVTYEIRSHQEVYNIAKKIADHMNADLIELTNCIQDSHRPTMVEDASPEEFVGYIKEAAFVVTTSFHGTVFSLLYKKAFFAIRQNTVADIRIGSLLCALNMEDRFIDKGELGFMNKLRRVEVNKELWDHLVSSSYSFILEALS